jgi:hypothetical protein
MPGSSHGFSLVEALIATMVMVAGIVGLAALYDVAVRTNAAARTATVASMLAVDRMEQLRSVPFVVGGVRPALSPSGTLSANIDGFCDFLDAKSNPARVDVATYVRRWAVTALAGDPDNAVVLQVVAFAIARPADRVQLVTVKARRP